MSDVGMIREMITLNFFSQNFNMNSVNYAGILWNDLSEIFGALIMNCSIPDSMHIIIVMVLQGRLITLSLIEDKGLSQFQS